MTHSDQSIESALSERFLQLYPDQLAAFVETLPPGDVPDLINSLPQADIASLFQHLRPDAAAGILTAIPRDMFVSIVPQLDAGQVAGVLGRFPTDLRADRLGSLDEKTARELSVLMSYPADSAGAIMDPRVTTFRPESTVEDAETRLRALTHKRVSDVFVVDGSGRLVGAVALQDLVLADPGERLDNLIRGRAVSIQATASQEEVLELIEASRLSSVPVTDFDGRLIGVIRQAALIAAAQSDATADIQSMVGASKDEKALSPVTFAVRRRLPWLQINLGTAFLAAAVVGIFEDTIAQFTALAVLLPVVAGQSGNTGSQALAVTMRGLALREIRARHWLRVTMKEVTAGALNGVAVAIVTSLAVLVWSGSAGLMAVIGVAMVVSMAIAGLAGASIPILLEKFGQDPAQASSIILTTVTDVVGFLSFLGLATAASGIL